MWRLDVAVLLVAVLVAASLPRTSRKKRAFPHQRRRCLCGGSCSRNACATAAQHARPSRAGRQRLPAHRASRSASCRAACCPFGDAPCVCFNGREHRSRGRPVSAAHAASPGASLRSRSRRRAHQTANGSGRGGMAVRPRTPRGTAMSLDPCLQCTVASARRERSSAIERALLQTRCDGREARQFAQWGAKRGITETCTCGFTKCVDGLGPRCDLS